MEVVDKNDECVPSSLPEYLTAELNGHTLQDTLGLLLLETLFSPRQLQSHLSQTVV